MSDQKRSEQDTLPNQPIAAGAPTKPLWAAARWIALLPCSFAVLVVVHLAAKLANLGSLSLMSIDTNSPLVQSQAEFAGGVLGGCALVHVAHCIAPSRKLLSAGVVYALFVAFVGASLLAQFSLRKPFNEMVALPCAAVCGFAMMVHLARSHQRGIKLELSLVSRGAGSMTPAGTPTLEGEESKNVRPRFPMRFLKIVINVYMAAFLLSIPYFNWQYAKQNGFMSWLFFGEVVATGKAMVWPYFVFGHRGTSMPAGSEPFEVRCSEPLPVFTLGEKSNPTREQQAALCGCLWQTLDSEDKKLSEKMAKSKESKPELSEQEKEFSSRFDRAFEKCGGWKL